MTIDGERAYDCMFADILLTWCVICIAVFVCLRMKKRKQQKAGHTENPA